jgi:hypothetical protein
MGNGEKLGFSESVFGKDRGRFPEQGVPIVGCRRETTHKAVQKRYLEDHK